MMDDWAAVSDTALLRSGKKLPSTACEKAKILMPPTLAWFTPQFVIATSARRCSRIVLSGLRTRRRPGPRLPNGTGVPSGHRYSKPYAVAARRVFLHRRRRSGDTFLFPPTRRLFTNIHHIGSAGQVGQAAHRSGKALSYSAMMNDTAAE